MTTDPDEPHPLDPQADPAPPDDGQIIAALADNNVCRHFRVRSMYVAAFEAEPEDADESHRPDQGCWCIRTMSEVGPDDGLVNVELCSTDARICYEAL